MSAYKNFAVVGAGTLGASIIEELLKLKSEGRVSSVVILTRSTENDQIRKLSSLGATVEKVDYSDSDSVAAALRGIDVVISTVGGNAGKSGLEVQPSLAGAAKQSGVKLFVPSEFGHDTIGATESIFGVKGSLQLKLRDLDLPYALFFTGPWPNYCLVPLFGFDFANGTVTISGEGSGLNSWTGQTDIARFVAHVLTALPREKIEWRVFRIESERKTINQIVEEYQDRTGKKLEVSRVSRSQLEEAIASNPLDLGSTLLLEWDLGKGLVGTPEQLANGEWPEWNPKGVVDVLLSRDMNLSLKSYW